MLSRGFSLLRGLTPSNSAVENRLCDEAQAEAARLHCSLDQLPVGFYIKNIRSEFILVGEQARQSLAAVSRLSPNAAFRQVPEEIAQRIAVEDRLVIDHGETLHRQIEVASEIDGLTRWFEISKRPFLNKAGECIGIIGTAVDITERRDQEAQAALLAARNAQQNKIKIEFLSSASHDLRQPLQTAFLHVAALESHVDADGGEVVKKLEAVLNVMRSLLDNLLDMSEIDGGSLSAQPTGVSVIEVISHLTAAFHPLAAHRGLNFEVIACDDVMVLTDRKLLIRLLSNLIENAITFTSDGTITLRVVRDGETLVISVSDTGSGIPSEHLDLIWNEFHQVGNSGRDRKKGLGLGLAIVRRLSALLEHSVSVTSSLGEGSTFTVRAPLITAPMPDDLRGGAVERILTSTRQRLITLVDDDVPLRDALSLCLTDAGFAVVAASSADELISMMQPGQVPDIVLMDYRLEHTLGVEEIVRLRDHFHRRVPSILLTGDIGTHVQKEAKTQDMRVIHKPISIRTLLSEIATVSVQTGPN